MQSQHPRVALAWRAGSVVPARGRGWARCRIEPWLAAAAAPSGAGFAPDGTDLPGFPLRAERWKLEGLCPHTWLRRGAARLPEQWARPARAGQLVLPHAFFTLIHIYPHVC